MESENDLCFLNSKIEKYVLGKVNSISNIKVVITTNLEKLYNCVPPYGLDKQISNVLKKYNLMCARLKSISYNEANNLVKEIESSEKEIQRLQYIQDYYKIETADIIDNFKTLITKIKTTNFLKKDSPEIKEDNELEVLKDKFYQVILNIFTQKEINEIIKQGNFIKEDKIVNLEASSAATHVVYNDMNRINFNQKYKYEKRCHFRDTINQYQGLQHKNLKETNVISDIEDMIEKHGLANTDFPKTDRLNRYSRVTKDHIRMFLSETKNPKYYEDLQLIYSLITGKKCPNISKFVTKLYEDFDLLVEAFLDIPSIVRKNFLNSHYVLRQLLRRYNHEIPEDDLSHLKTPTRKRQHDDIYQKCCEKLGWNFLPLY
jgi:hypothetical protein